MKISTLLAAAAIASAALALPVLAADEVTFPGTPPSAWKGSNGVKQPTGFEVPGLTNYELKNGKVVQYNPWNTRDPEFFKRGDRKGQNGGCCAGAGSNDF